jgi:hypothetical protein
VQLKILDEVFIPRSTGTEDAFITVGGRRKQTLVDSGPRDFDLYHRPDTNPAFCFLGATSQTRPQ